MCDKRSMQNILMPTNHCLHNQKGHTHRFKDQYNDHQINTTVVMYLLQPMKMIIYCRTCPTVSHKSKIKPFHWKLNNIKGMGSVICASLLERKQSSITMYVSIKVIIVATIFATVLNVLFQILNIFDIGIHKVIQEERFTVVSSWTSISTHQPTAQYLTPTCKFPLQCSRNPCSFILFRNGFKNTNIAAFHMIFRIITWFPCSNILLVPCTRQLLIKLTVTDTFIM
jgi:hypothetical protein